ncbi:hypothetical protein AB0D24_04525 [Streptomyces javensis]|uniref:hypothetical protein n=1 Tax=Streptomyces javensis TaxID=114698 RepID=UPI0033EC821D
MAQFGCGGSRCTCVVTAGPGVTVTGNGSAGAPYVIGASAVTTGCGLTGDGSAGAPLQAATGAWPYPCDVAAYGGGVYCDGVGVLRTDPRSQATYTQDQVNQMYPSTAVPPDSPGIAIETRTLGITNPDPCREAYVIAEVEVDVDFDLPAGSGAAYGISTDEMYYTANSGAATVLDAHVQTTKVYQRTIPAGGTLAEPLQIIMGRGTGGATYNRIQSFMRAFVFNL